MHDVAEPLDHKTLGHAHAAELCHAAHVVAAEIDQHQVLGAFLGVGQQRALERQVLGPVDAAAAGAGERPDGDDALADPHQDLGARPHDRETLRIGGQLEHVEEGRRVDPP